MNTNDSRLAKQIEFIVEIDKLKQVYRRTWLTDESRKENDAEHSWHLGVMAILLLEHAQQPQLDLLRVLAVPHTCNEIVAWTNTIYPNSVLTAWSLAVTTPV
jgi:5'-deoxynucleotidase YfbR-like HD superfamily hydrolase